jgi:DNA-binding response OmpR family regulator
MKTFLPDLILLDLILPGKSGFEVMEEINADPQAQKTPIIVLSNLGQDTDMTRGKGLGAVQYVVKARITIDDLVKQIRDFLAANKPKA